MAKLNTSKIFISYKIDSQLSFLKANGTTLSKTLVKNEYGEKLWQHYKIQQGRYDLFCQPERRTWITRKGLSKRDMLWPCCRHVPLGQRGTCHCKFYWTCVRYYFVPLKRCRNVPLQQCPLVCWSPCDEYSVSAPVLDHVMGGPIVKQNVYLADEWYRSNVDLLHL